MANYQNTPIRQTTPEEEAALRRLAATPKSPQSAVPGLPSPPPGMRVTPTQVAPGITTNIAKPYEQRGGPVGRPTLQTAPMKQATAALRNPPKPAAQPTSDVIGVGGRVLRTPSEQAMATAPLATGAPRPVAPAIVEDRPISGGPAPAMGRAIDRAVRVQPSPESTQPPMPTNTAYERGAWARDKLGGLVTPFKGITATYGAVNSLADKNRRAAGEFVGGLVGAVPPEKPNLEMPTLPNPLDAVKATADKFTTPAAKPITPPAPASMPAEPTVNVPYSPVGPNQVEADIGRPLPPPGMVEVIRPSAAGGFQFTNELGGDIRPVGMDDRTAREFGGFRNAGLTAPDSMQGVEILRRAQTDARQADAQMIQAQAAQTNAQTNADRLNMEVGTDIFIPDANDPTKGKVGFVRRDRNGQLVIEETPIIRYQDVDQTTGKVWVRKEDSAGRREEREYYVDKRTNQILGEAPGKEKNAAFLSQFPAEDRAAAEIAAVRLGPYAQNEDQLAQMVADTIQRAKAKQREATAEPTQE